MALMARMSLVLGECEKPKHSTVKMSHALLLHLGQNRHAEQQANAQQAVLSILRKFVRGAQY